MAKLHTRSSDEHGHLQRRLYGRFNNVNHDINFRLRELLRERKFLEFDRLKKSVGLNEFIDSRVKIRSAVTSSAKFENILFLAGLHRSGTTMMEQLLVSKYRAAFLNAPVPENEGQFLQDVVATDNSFGGPGTFSFYPQMQANPFLDEGQAELERSRILECWSSWIVGDEGTFIEKSPPNIVRIPYLRRLFKSAKFVIIVRDPRAVSVATRKWNGIPPLLHFLHWCTAHLIALEALDCDCMIIRYEDLCLEPERVIKMIGEFADLTERPTPLTISDRYKNIENRNDSYIRLFGKLPKVLDRKMFIKPWEILGYDLSETFVETAW